MVAAGSCSSRRVVGHCRGPRSFVAEADLQLAWCHLAPAEVFHQTSDSPGASSRWRRLQREAGLPDIFVLLPATSAIGSYKNPELVAQALADRDLLSLPLVLCGIAAEQRAQELELRFPHLRGRVLAAGFSDYELMLVYRQALAVVIPSRIEGFGLPAIEVMASGGLSLVADARGLREAGAEAALRFSARQPGQLSDLLKLVQILLRESGCRASCYRARALTPCPSQSRPDWSGLARSGTKGHSRLNRRNYCLCLQGSKRFIDSIDLVRFIPLSRSYCRKRLLWQENEHFVES